MTNDPVGPDGGLDGGPDAAAPYDEPDLDAGGKADAALDAGADGSAARPDAGRDSGPMVALPPPIECEDLPAIAPRLGHALAVGDFDADGRDDLALGYPTSINQAGAVCVRYGRDYASGAFAGDCQMLDQGSPGMPGEAETASATHPGDHFGMALTTGDFDGNGVPDLAVGVPDESLEEQLADADGDPVDELVGLVQVVFGSAGRGLNALDAQQRPLIAPLSWDQDRDGVPNGINEDGDHIGAALAACDSDGDSASEIIIGVPGEALGEVAGAGIVYRAPAPIQVVGPSRGFSQLAFSDASAWPVTEAQFTPEPGEQLGSSVFAVPASIAERAGQQLILAGAPFEGSGAVYAWFVDPARNDFLRPVTKTVLATGSSEPDRFGHAIASDGRHVFVGAPGAAAGACRVYRVDLAAIPASPDGWPAFQEIAQPSSVGDGPEPGDAFGSALAIQTTGIHRLLLVGAPGERRGDDCQTGIVHRFRIPDLTYVDSVELDDTYRMFGHALGAGDFDGDGDQEAVASAPGGATGGLWISD
jgi:hypothetical protein